MKKPIIRLTIAFAVIAVVATVGAMSWNKKLDDRSQMVVVKDAIAKFGSQYHIDGVSKAPFPGFYQATVGAQVLYVSEDGRHVVEGQAIEVASKKNVTKPVIERQVATMLQKAAGTGLAYKPDGQSRGTLYVFTDPSCGYCRKFHEHIPEFKSKGIEVVYLAFPRNGPNAPEAAQLAEVFCAMDKPAAMEQAFSGPAAAPAPPKCKSPVESHLQLGLRLGIQGTPGIFTADGRNIGGYVTVDQALAELEGKGPSTSPRG